MSNSESRDRRLALRPNAIGTCQQAIIRQPEQASAPALRLSQNCSKTSSVEATWVDCRAKSRFPKLLERLKKDETDWSNWKGLSRAQGRCATRLRYAPTIPALLILKHFRTKRPSFITVPIQNWATIYMTNQICYDLPREDGATRGSRQNRDA